MRTAVGNVTETSEETKELINDTIGVGLRISPRQFPVHWPINGRLSLLITERTCHAGHRLLDTWLITAEKLKGRRAEVNALKDNPIFGRET